MQTSSYRTFFYRAILAITLFSFFVGFSFAQTTKTAVRGDIKDAVTKETLPFVSIQFENSTTGTITKDDGTFYLSNNHNLTQVAVTFIGYETYTFTIPKGRTTTKHILLQPTDLALNEVVVKPKKEKYKKKDNPAVALIKKVIAHKDSNNINTQDYYQYDEYERLLIALNNFKPEQSQFKKFKFLPNYVDTSLIDNKKILPFSVREKVSSVFYRKEPKSEKRIIQGFKLEGLDQGFQTEGLNVAIEETFKDVSIYDNNITLLLNNFVGPLNSHLSPDFYKWYIEDTISIDATKYIRMSFTPFNNRDMGFTGHLYISTDGSYGVKRAILRTPKNININFVDELVIDHSFTKNEYGRWIPEELKMAMDLSVWNAVKFYVDKSQSFNNITFNQPADIDIYAMEAPAIKADDYLKKSDDFWATNHALYKGKDYRMGELVHELKGFGFMKGLIKTAELMSSGYFATNKDPDKNKVDIGTIPTFFSYNSLEGGRLKVTAATNANFHPNLFLFGYTAYGLKDNTFKYMAEGTWAFNKREKHKDEYTKNNLTFSHSYDVNFLGQRFTQSERDHIMMSLRSNKDEKITYNRSTKLSYEKEYYNGFSGEIMAMVLDSRSTGKPQFTKTDEFGNIHNMRGIKTSELNLGLKYSTREVFYQHRRRRIPIPAEKFTANLAHTIGFKGVIGGQYNFNRTSLQLSWDKWLAPFGKLSTSVGGEKLWGKVPYPLLITPSANTSYTVQSGSFYLLEPLEFMHDQQVSWEIYYYMGGWLFNRIPLIKYLKWKEVFGFRGFYGKLSDKNNPAKTPGVMHFPEDSFQTRGGTPYMEFNVGIENIFNFFRVDYVHRINYRKNPNISKNGVRVSFEFNF